MKVVVSNSSSQVWNTDLFIHCQRKINISYFSPVIPNREIAFIIVGVGLIDSGCSIMKVEKPLSAG
jgi:hypothetical protein